MLIYLNDSLNGNVEFGTLADQVDVPACKAPIRRPKLILKRQRICSLDLKTNWKNSETITFCFIYMYQRTQVLFTSFICSRFA